MVPVRSSGLLTFSEGRSFRPLQPRLSFGQLLQVALDGEEPLREFQQAGVKFLAFGRWHPSGA
jgi:hypothetical protein